MIAFYLKSTKTLRLLIWYKEKWYDFGTNTGRNSGHHAKKSGLIECVVTIETNFKIAVINFEFNLSVIMHMTDHVMILIENIFQLHSFLETND